MSKDDSNIEWITLHLMPKLVQSGKFTLTSDENLSGADIMKIKSYDIQSLSAKDVFMLTMCYKVKVYLTDHIDGSKEHCFALVVKITPNVDKQLYDTFNYDSLFKNEIVAYEEVFPMLGWSDKYPKYYYSHIRNDGAHQAVIALGDFTHNGWSMSRYTVNLPLDHIMIAVQELGRFHGTFYALKHMDRQKFDALKDRFEESRFRHRTTSFEWDTLLRTGPKRAIGSVRQHVPSIPEWFLCKLAAILSDPFNYQRQMVMHNEPMATLCHGDYLRNNIAFYYSTETNGQTDDEDEPNPSKAMIFDFQTLRYSSPMVDLATFMFNSTGWTVRNEYFRTIFSAYHGQVIQNFCTATMVGSNDVPDYLSYDSFLCEYAKYMPFGLSIAGSFLPVLHEPQEFDMTQPIRTFSEITKEGFERGGEVVDAELRALVVDMYNLYQELNLDLALVECGVDYGGKRQSAAEVASSSSVTIST